MGGTMIRKQSIQDGRVQLQADLLIKQPPSVCYHFWRDFKNLPRFMDHLDSIEVIDKKRSHWIVEAPADTTIEWDAEILEDIPNQRLHWRSLEGSEVNNSGSVSFRPMDNGRATQLQVVLTYDPPLGRLGDVL